VVADRIGISPGRYRYALLVAREIRYGHTRFQDIAMSTGAPRDVLTARLRKLEQAGVIERRQYSQRPPRHEYLLTDAGQALRPILLALKEWGDRYVNPGAEPVIFQHTCGAEFQPLTVCAACWDNRHVTEHSERVCPRPAAIGYVSHGRVAAF
jgi:DNA-binding HxlR family transcriptional regulator